MILHIIHKICTHTEKKSIWWRIIFLYEKETYPHPHTRFGECYVKTVKHEKWRPLNLSPQWFKLTPIYYASLSFSLSLFLPLYRFCTTINENPILTIIVHRNTHYVTRNLDYFIFNLGFVCLTYLREKKIILAVIQSAATCFM